MQCPVMNAIWHKISGLKVAIEVFLEPMYNESHCGRGKEGSVCDKALKLLAISKSDKYLLLSK